MLSLVVEVALNKNVNVNENEIEDGNVLEDWNEDEDDFGWKELRIEMKMMSSRDDLNLNCHFFEQPIVRHSIH